MRKTRRAKPRARKQSKKVRSEAAKRGWKTRRRNLAHKAKPKAKAEAKKIPASPRRKPKLAPRPTRRIPTDAKITASQRRALAVIASARAALDEKQKAFDAKVEAFNQKTLFATAPSDQDIKRDAMKTRAAIALANLLSTPSREVYTEWGISKLDLIDEIGAVAWHDWIEEVGEDYEMPEDGPNSIRSFADSTPNAEA